MALSFEHSPMSNMQTDLLLVYHAIMLMNDMPETMVWAGDTLQSWFAFRARHDKGALGVIVCRDGVAMERHSHLAREQRALMRKGVQQPVDGACNAQDCITSLQTTAVFERTRIGYAASDLFAWQPDKGRLLAGSNSQPLAPRSSITLEEAPQLVGERLAWLEWHGHVIHNEALGALAATRYAKYYP